LTIPEEPPSGGSSGPAPITVGPDDLAAFWSNEVRPTAVALLLGGASLFWVGFGAVALGSYSFSAPLTHSVLIGEAIALILLGPCLLLFGAWLWNMQATKLEISADGIHIWFRSNRDFFVGWCDAVLRVEIVDRRERRPAPGLESAGILRIRRRRYGISAAAVDLALAQAKRNGLSIRSGHRTGTRGILHVHLVTGPT
jgi:hypothetical protein